MKRTFQVIALLALIFSVFLWLFLFTETGLQLLVRTGERLSQGRVKVDETIGKLGTSFTIKGLSYSNGGFSLEVDHILASWHPVALFRGEFHLTGLFIRGVKLVTSEEEDKASQKQNGVSLPEVTLPLAILLKRIEIEDVEIASGSGPATKIDRAVLEMDGRRDFIKIYVMEVKARDYNISLSGSIGMSQNWPAEITGEWVVETPDFPKLNGSCSLSGALKKGRLELDVTAPFVVGINTDYSLDETVKWQSVLVASGVDPGLFFEEFPGDLNMDAVVTGQFAGGDLTADVDLKRIEGELRAYPVWLKSKARLENNSLEITEVLVKSGNSKFVASGTLASDLDLSFDLSSDNIADLLPGTTGQIQIQGNIGGTQLRPRVKASIQGRNLEGEGVAIGALNASVDGAVHSDGTIDAEIVLGDVRYKENQIDKARLHLFGGLENHQIQLHFLQKEKELSLELLGKVANMSWGGEVKDLFFSLTSDDAIHLEKPASLEVSSEKVVLGDLCLLHDGGKVCLVGQWQKGKWQAGAHLLNFDPGYFSKDWPGKVDGKLTGQGDFSQNGGLHYIELQSLSGNLKGEPLSGGGLINVEKSNMDFKDFFLRLGQANFAVEGFLSDTFDLRFEGEVPDIGGFIPDSGGSFSFAGNLKGDRGAPVVHLNFDAQQAKIAKITLAEMSGRADIDLSQDGQVSSNINVSGVATEFLEITDGNMQIKGTTGKHELLLELSTSKGDVRLKGDGGYDSSWNGALSELTVLHSSYGEWSLDGEAELVFGPEEKRVSDFCLRNTKASMCVDISYGLEKNWKFGMEVSSLDLSLLNDIQITTIPMEGSLQGTFMADGQDNVIATLDAEYSVPRLLLSNTFEEETLTYSFEQNNVQLHLIDDMLSLNLQAQFQGDSNFNGSVRMSGANDISADFGTLPVEGDVGLSIDDFSFVTIITNSLVKPQGKAEGELKLTGSIIEPEIQGDFSLQEGGIEVPGFGINVHDLAVTIDAGQDGLVFDYSGKSGSGKLQGKGRFLINANKGWQVKTEITGSDFELIATEEYQINVDPNVHLELDQDGGRLWGELRIPFARISLEGEGGSVSPSDDVVFIDDLDNEQQKKRSFETDLSIVLGDDVKIDGFGLKSNLAGQLRLKDIPGKTLTATGELVVKDGNFSLYSTAMEITRGRLFFTGGPVDNPGVDVLAQRTVDKKVVGVNVSGTVNDLEFLLFSDPVMEQSEILAYIVVGRSMSGSSDNEQSLVGAAATALGVGGANKIFGKMGDFVPVDEVYLDGGKNSEDMSIVVGKNVTEDLFIGYDHNVFDSTGEFKVRYKLGYGFSVETSSSVEATSGDILYSLER